MQFVVGGVMVLALALMARPAAAMDLLWWIRK